jgi:hypothetical protein
VSELGPEGRELVSAGRAAFKPTAADRERVLQALAPQLGTSTGGSLAVAHGAARGIVGKLSLVVVGLGVVGGGAMLMRPDDPPPKLVAPIVAPSSAPVVPVVIDRDAPLEAPTAPPPSEPVTTESAKAPAPTSSRTEDHLALEVAILSRAGAALRGGRPGAALEALDEHQRRFPSGVLSQERSAARIQALCALGRTREGLSELARLERRAPTSPHVVRARKACDLDQATP